MKRRTGLIVVVSLLAIALGGCEKKTQAPAVVTGTPKKVSAIALFSIGWTRAGKENLSNGSIIPSDEWVDVGSRSLLDLQLRDTQAVVTIRLRAGAKFRFRALVDSNGRVTHKLELASGSALFNVSKLTKGEGLVIVTPSSQSEVRGTKLSVDVAGNGSTHTKVLEGSITSRMRIPEVEDLPAPVIAKSEVLGSVVAETVKTEKNLTVGQSIDFERKTSQSALKALPKLEQALKTLDEKKAVVQGDKITDQQATNAGKLIDDFFKDEPSRKKVSAELDRAIMKEIAKVKPLDKNDLQKELKEYQEIVAVDQTKLKDEKEARKIVAANVQKQTNTLIKRIESTLGKAKETLSLVGGSRISGVIEQRGEDFVVHTPSGSVHLRSSQVSGFSF